ITWKTCAIKELINTKGGAMNGERSPLHTDRLATIVLAGLLVLAALLRMYHLDVTGLWADELWSLRDVNSASWAGMIFQVYQYDGHPPGYHMILRVVTTLFGQSESVIRLPSVLAGIALVASVYALAKRHLTVQVGLLAAAFVSLSFSAILYSQE